MKLSMELKSAVGELRTVLAQRQSDSVFKALTASKADVLARFGPVFSPENIPSLTEQEVRDFLIFENNKHWNGLQRKGPAICSNMDTLRHALAILVDERIPVDNRLDQLRPQGKAAIVPNLGKAVLTAILQVEYPEKYGVWNQTSEGSMETLKIWPLFEDRDSFGQRYLRINELLLELADELKIDLWTLDSLCGA